MNVLPGKRKKPLPQRIAGWADNLLFALFLLMIFAVTANMASRLFFQRPIILSDELSRYSFIWLCFIGSVSALNAGEHVGVDLFVKRLPEKLARLTLILTNLAMSAVTAIFSVYGFILAMKSFQPMTGGIPIPYGAIVLVMPLSFIAMSLIFLWNFCCLLRGPQ